MSAAVQIYSCNFDVDFLKLPQTLRERIEAVVDRLGMTLDTHPHQKLKGVDAYRIRVGDYRVIYDFNRATSELHLLAIGHRREVYRK